MIHRKQKYKTLGTFGIKQKIRQKRVHHRSNTEGGKLVSDTVSPPLPKSNVDVVP
jgi:hypothetical protein